MIQNYHFRPYLGRMRSYDHETFRKSSQPTTCTEELLEKITTSSTVGSSLFGSYTGIVGYADDVILMNSTLSGLQKLIDNCVEYNNNHAKCGENRISDIRYTNSREHPHRNISPPNSTSKQTQTSRFHMEQKAKQGYPEWCQYPGTNKQVLGCNLCSCQGSDTFLPARVNSRTVQNFGSPHSHIWTRTPTPDGVTTIQHRQRRKKSTQIYVQPITVCEKPSQYPIQTRFHLHNHHQQQNQTDISSHVQPNHPASRVIKPAIYKDLPIHHTGLLQNSMHTRL